MLFFFSSDQISLEHFTCGPSQVQGGHARGETLMEVNYKINCIAPFLKELSCVLKTGRM